jgi:hypothetical protein
MDDIKVVDDAKALQIMQNFIEKTPLLDAAQKDKLRAHVQELAKTPGELAKLMNQFQVEYQQAKTVAKYDAIDKAIEKLQQDPDLDKSKLGQTADYLSGLSINKLQAIASITDEDILNEENNQ